MGGRVSAESSIRIFVVRPAVGVDHAEVGVQFIQLDQFVPRLHQLYRIRVPQEIKRRAARHTIHGRASEFKIHRGHRFDFCRRPRLVGRHFLRRHLRIELPQRRGIARVVPSRRTRKPHSREVRMAVGRTWSRSAFRQGMKSGLRRITAGILFPLSGSAHRNARRRQSCQRQKATRATKIDPRPFSSAHVRNRFPPLPYGHRPF